MIISIPTVDHDGECVVIKHDNGKLWIEAEEAIRLAHDILDNAEKALRSQNKPNDE